MSTITLRPPTFSRARAPPEYKSPSIPWLSEEWHITHSTLPMWKSKRNVRIQYTPLEPSNPSIPKENTDRLGDFITYQGLQSEKISKINGIDKTAGSGDTRGEWDWRGKGWLMVMSSHWEMLCWGEEQTGNKYMVTMFGKTWFTPAGIDVYSKDRAGLREETLEEIKRALAEVDDENVRKISSEIFKVKIDDARMD